MSLNKYMHPRNRYKYKKPDFNTLAQKYPEFKQYVIDNPKGKPVVDFKNPEAVRVLTTCLLREDFGVDVELPPDRLVPTLPLRLNYVHWIEDITSNWGKKELSGIDIGTGACCVYPVLAVSGNPWKFLATEADDVNFNYATKNMEKNKLTDKINVVKVQENTILEGVIGNNTENYDFCMCNPPFFADHFEAQGLLSRTPNRPDPKTMSTASPQEGIVEGGEVSFVKKMIEESVFLQNRVRVYTSMLGKKTSLAPLKEVLRRHQVPSFAATEFCQGKTMRWGLAWTFDKSVTFPKSEFLMSKKDTKKSLVHTIPTAMGERREQIYDMVSYLKKVFSELQIHCREGKQTKHFALMTLTAAENTWIHSRRKRRQMMREAAAAAAVTPTTPSQTATATSATAETGATPSSGITTSETVATSTTSETTTSETATANISETDTTKSEAMVTEISASAPEISRGETESDSVGKKEETLQKQSSQTVTDDSDASTGFDPVSEYSDHHTESADTSGNALASEVKSSAKDYNDGGGGMEGESIESCRNGKRKAADEPSESPQGREETRGESLPKKPKLDKDDAEDDGESQMTDANNSASKLESAKTTDNSLSDDTNNIVSITTVSEAETLSKDNAEISEMKADTRPPAEYVLKCHASVRVQGPDLALEMTWLDGEDIQLLHQLMQYLKNRLTARSK